MTGAMWRKCIRIRHADLGAPSRHKGMLCVSGVVLSEEQEAERAWAEQAVADAMASTEAMVNSWTPLPSESMEVRPRGQRQPARSFFKMSSPLRPQSSGRECSWWTAVTGQTFLQVVLTAVWPPGVTLVSIYTWHCKGWCARNVKWTHKLVWRGVLWSGRAVVASPSLLPMADEIEVSAEAPTSPHWPVAMEPRAVPGTLSKRKLVEQKSLPHSPPIGCAPGLPNFTQDTQVTSQSEAGEIWSNVVSLEQALLACLQVAGVEHGKVAVP